MNTKIKLKKEVQHKLGSKSLAPSIHPPALTITNSFLHNTVHAAGHDLRSPLFIIRAYSQLLQKTQDKSMLDNGLRLMDEATSKMEKTLNEFVGLIDIYTLPFPEKTNISFENAFEAAMFQLVSLFHEYRPNVTCDFDDFPTIKFNEKYLIDILSCLIDNAIRHNTQNENLAIKIFTKKEENGLVLVVQDNGHGIEDDLEKIKNPFYSYTKEEQPDCIGIGLAKVQAIAQVSQNSFYLQSELGGFTTANFVFKN